MKKSNVHSLLCGRSFADFPENESRAPVYFKHPCFNLLREKVNKMPWEVIRIIRIIFSICCFLPNPKYINIETEIRSPLIYITLHGFL